MKTEILIRLLTYYMDNQVNNIYIEKIDDNIYHVEIIYCNDNKLYQDAYYINNLIGSWDIDYLKERCMKICYKKH